MNKVYPFILEMLPEIPANTIELSGDTIKFNLTGRHLIIDEYYQGSINSIEAVHKAFKDSDLDIHKYVYPSSLVEESNERRIDEIKEAAGIRLVRLHRQIDELTARLAQVEAELEASKK